ncbi:serine hydrolase [Fictibacillus aquaticus]|uniref:Beta-lactamase class A catalytic domain-containing protein n=1 Tax=Fictibacillus aquaticus TaxID=2021314 RepID=A0A235F5U1_9BACL|nr:serine hydrolase [Fictibacillus aquaticus]OYD56588.1 hypothetical protein CGZ90_16380 [Fictibacillus aquaticus]
MDIITRLEELKGSAGLIVFSTKDQQVIVSANSSLSVPLASAAKVALGFCIGKWVEEGLFQWDNMVEDIVFDANEDSKELYPHFQGRSALPLKDAVEVMIACHDHKVADRLALFCGGWEKVNHHIRRYYTSIHITDNPLDNHNCGELQDVFHLLQTVFQEYKINPMIWAPIINGLVRQQGYSENIPKHQLNHMTGGMLNALVNVGILGEFHQHPLLYVFGAKNLPDRRQHSSADHLVTDLLHHIYQEYLKQDLNISVTK